MRKAAVTVILLAVGAVTLALTIPTPSPQDNDIVGLYRNTTEGFPVLLPDGWTGEESDGTLPLLTTGSEEHGPRFNAQLWVFRRLDDGSAGSWIDAQFLRYDPGSIASSEARPYPGADSGYQSSISKPLKDGATLSELWTAAARGSQMSLLRERTSEEPWRKVTPQADAFANSFPLETPMPFGVSREDSLYQYWREIVGIDPARSRSGAGDIVGAIFSGLLKLDTDLQVVADMAEAWEVSPDGTVFTFKLRDNARFHDGRPVTAEDFKYSWERALDPATESPVAYTYLGDIVGADAIVEGETTSLEGVEALDAQTLQVTIKGPFSYFLAKLTYPTSFVVDRANVESGEDWTDAPNGTGAFRLKSWRRTSCSSSNATRTGTGAPPPWPMPSTASSPAAPCKCTKTARSTWFASASTTSTEPEILPTPSTRICGKGRPSAPATWGSTSSSRPSTIRTCGRRWPWHWR